MLKLKLATILVMATMVIANMANAEDVAGGKNPMDLKEAGKILKQVLKELSELNGPFYKIDKINSATVQIVAGFKYEINANLIDNAKNTKTCDIEILAKAALIPEMEVTFKCPGEADIIKKYTRGHF